MPRKRESEGRPERPQEVSAAIEKLKTLKSNEAEMDPADLVEKKLARLPESLREVVKANLEQERQLLKEDGATDEVIEKVIARMASREVFRHLGSFDERFVNKKMSIPKEAFAKAEIIKNVDQIFENSPTVEDFKKIARLSFDANGLKAVNDLAGHEAGNKFLLEIAKVLYDENGETRDWLKKECGVTEIILTTSSSAGDEFNFMLKSEKPLEEDVISEAISRFEAEVTEKAKVSDLIDFSDEEVRRRLGRGGEEVEVPKGFKFEASVAGGGATLVDSLGYVVSEEPPVGRRLTGKEDYQRSLEIIMGGLLDVADKNGREAKADFKKGLAESEDPKEQFWASLLARTAEARELQKEKSELEATIGEAITDLEASEKIDDPEVVKKVVKQVTRKLRKQE